MASIIKLKRSAVASAVPSTLQEGEIAVNIVDKKLYVGGVNGGSNTQTLSGDQYNLTSANGSDAATITLTVDNDVLSNDAITIAGGEGVDVSESGGTITLAGEDATVSNKGIASFATADFSVTSGAVSVKTGGIATAQLAADAVDGTKIANDAIAAEHIASNAVVSDSIVNKTIVGGDIADATITATQLASGAITANTVSNNSVALGTKTTGNYVATVSAGTDMAVSGSGSETAGVTVSLSPSIASNTSGTAAEATILATGRTISTTGDVAFTSGSFDGSGNVTGTATIQANSVNLGAMTTGNYVATASGTANEIEVSGSGGETAGITIGLPNDVTIANDLTVSGAAGIVGNVTIDGNLTVEGATTYISSSTVNVDDSAIKLSANNAADTVDIGMYGKYVVGGTATFGGWHRDASDSGVFKFYKDITAEPGTTVNTAHASYAQGTIEATIDGGSY